MTDRTIDSVPSCGQENDHRNVDKARAWDAVAEKNAEIERLRAELVRSEVAWLLLHRWENIARNGGQKWLREHPLVDETTKLLNEEATSTISNPQTSQPGPMPPSGRVTDGGCIKPGDASAVDLSTRQATIEECAKLADWAVATAKKHYGAEASVGAHMAGRAIRALLLIGDQPWTAYLDGAGEPL